MILEKIKTCAICEEEKDSSINIQGVHLCAACERKLVSTEVNAPEYSLFIAKLKNMFFLKENAS